MADLRLTTASKPVPPAPPPDIEGDVDWTEATLLRLHGTLKSGDVSGIVTLTRNNRNVIFEIRPDAANLSSSEYPEDPGKYSYHKPRGWGRLESQMVHIDGVSGAQLWWGLVKCYPGELKDGWIYANLPTLNAHFTHDQADPIFALFGIESYASLTE